MVGETFVSPSKERIIVTIKVRASKLCSGGFAPGSHDVFPILTKRITDQCDFLTLKGLVH